MLCPYFSFFLLLPYTAATKKPHIIYIIADDVGYNDFSFHGSGEIQTPNIDALGYNGVIFNNLYTQPSCSPSRTALLSGFYPLRTSLQGNPILIQENITLPLNVTLMPEYLNKLGYESHAVGKWHLGYATPKHTPTRRGFNSHFGYWNGEVDYFNYTASYLTGVCIVAFIINVASDWHLLNEDDLAADREEEEIILMIVDELIKR